MAIAGLLNQQGTLEVMASDGGRHGERTFNAPVNIRMRFEQAETTYVSAQKERLPINGKVWLMPEVNVHRGDRITYLGQQYRVMTLSPIIHGNGKVHHTEAGLQFWSYA